MKKQTLAYKNAESLEDFYASPEKYFNAKGKNGNYKHFAKNHVAFDLGFGNLIGDSAIISEAIAKLDQTYDLVLIRSHI